MTNLKTIRARFARNPGLPFAQVLTQSMIRDVLNDHGVTYRDRVFNPVTTIWGFLSQVLSDDHSCRDAVARIIAHRAASGIEVCSPNTASYCNARRRIQTGVLRTLAKRTAQELQRNAAEEWKWNGRSVFIADGSHVSMPDTPKNQARYLQPPTQKPGLGFPLARITVLLSLATGACHDLALAPYKGKGTGETTLLRRMYDALKPSDVVLADALFDNYFLICDLRDRGVDVVVRAKHPRVKSLTEQCRPDEDIIVWQRPNKPHGMRGEQYRSYPRTLRMREVAVDARDKNNRVKQFRVVTTILDAAIDGAQIGSLYERRWNGEVNIRSIKSTMQMDILRCKTPEMVEKEIWTHLLAYNLLRTVMAVAASEQGIVPCQVTCLDSEKQRTRFKLHIGSLEAHTGTMIAKSDKPFRDLHWHPDGSRLGLLRGGDTGAFCLVDPVAKSVQTIGNEQYLHFAGWDATGEQLAFVASQPLPYDSVKSWAFLLLPDVRARNRVLIASDADPSQTRAIFSGLQVTFPQWSPTEAKLSMWATFRPAYRSWLSYLLDLGGDAQDPLRGLTLRPGDPALVLDPTTSSRSWKAINAREKTQVGHYHLLHREYGEAWDWYEQAAAEAPNAEDRSPRQFIQRFVQGGDSLFFQAFCLDKLGRADEARSKRRQFDETFLPELSAAARAPNTNQLAPFGAADIQPSPEQLQHLRDLYIAEVFLSLDAVEEGECFFRKELKTATTEADRLSKALVLTQFLLLRNKNEEYAELATDTVLPCLLRAWKPRNQPGPPQQPANLVLAYSDSLSLLPLFAPKFLAGLSENQVRSLVPRWQRLRSHADDDVKRLGMELFLQAAADRLGQPNEKQAAANRIASNPARQEILGDKGVADLIESIRSAPKVLAQLHDRLH